MTEEDAEVHYDLAIAYREMGLMTDAITEFRVAMQFPPRRVLCYLMIGLCYSELGQYLEAIASLQAALSVEDIADRERISVHYELGQVYERQGDIHHAILYYKRVYAEDRNFRDINALLDRVRHGSRGPSRPN